MSAVTVCTVLDSLLGTSRWTGYWNNYSENSVHRSNKLAGTNVQLRWSRLQTCLLGTVAERRCNRLVYVVYIEVCYSANNY